MQPVLTAVRDAKAGMLFFPVFQPEGNFIVLQAKKVAGLENIVLMSDCALIVSSFIEAVKGDGVGMYFVGPIPPKGPAGDALVSEYESRYSEVPLTIYYQSAFDATNILLNAIKEVSVQEKDGTLHIGRQALRDALYATKDFDGVTGRLTCDEFGDCAFPRFSIMRLDDPAAGLEGLKSNVVYTYEPGK